MVFYIPLGFSVAFVISFWLMDEDLKWKVVATTLVAASLLMQFVPFLQVHPLVPLLIQIVVCIWMAIYWKMQL